MDKKFDWGKIGPLAVGAALIVLMIAVAGVGRIEIKDPWAENPIHFNIVDDGGKDCSPEALAKLPFDDKIRTARTSMERAKLKRDEGKNLPPEQSDPLRIQADGMFSCADRAFDAALLDAAAFGPKDKRYTDLLNEVAYYHLYDRNGLERAVALFTQLTQVREAGEGPTSPNLALDLNKLANVHAYAGRAPEAEKNFRRGLDIVIANPSNPDAKRTLVKDFSFFLDRQGRKDEAQEVLKK